MSSSVEKRGTHDDRGRLERDLLVMVKQSNTSHSVEVREQCTRCGEMLAPDSVEWLELNCETNRYDIAGCVPMGQSQGCFAFGYACMKAVLTAGGKLRRIKAAA